MNNKQLDSYSMLICSKYFTNKQDYINIICVCKKFKETTEKLRYNPIPITSLKLFPKIQTQYLYSKQDNKIEGINNYEILYEVDYDKYLQYKNVKCHNVKYTTSCKVLTNKLIPENVNILNPSCFSFEDFSTIYIPNTITSIKENCFCHCSYLLNIILSTSLSTICNSCFSNCISLSSITIPSTIKSFGHYCFSDCLKLQIINIPVSITSIGCNCFDNCTSLQSITIPSSLSILEDGLFSACHSLTLVELPLTLVSIESNCFSDCSSLTSIELPSLLKTIGRECFSGCRIDTIEIPESVKSLGVDCFLDIPTLSNLQFQESINELTFKVSYNDSIIYNKFGIKCSNIMLTENDIEYHLSEMEDQQTNIKNHFIIPNGIVSIDDNCFSNNFLIEKITIPTTVTSIGRNCFQYSENLTSVSIPSTVKSIGIGLVRECNSLQQISLPLNENIKYPFKVTYDEYLLLGQCGITCENIIYKGYRTKKYSQKIPPDIPFIVDIQWDTLEVMIPNNVISLKSNHLSTRITSITIPTNVTFLCDEYFKGYSKLQSITIPTTLNYIGKHLIDSCNSLTEFNYEGNWSNIVVSYDDHLRYKSIGLLYNSIEYTNDDRKKYGNIIPSIVHSLHHSYYNRSNEMIHIPNHITSLDNFMFSSVFDNYSNIISITIPTSVKIIPKYCFLSCKLLTSIELPSTLIQIKKGSFEECISLQSITIPSSVTSIEKYAFRYCYSLIKLILPIPLPMIGNGCFKECSQLKGTHAELNNYF